MISSLKEFYLGKNSATRLIHRTELSAQPIIFLSCALPKILENKNEKPVLTTNNCIVEVIPEGKC